MKKITITEWFRTLPGNAYLNSTDIMNLFGYKNTNNINTKINNGILPKPTKKNRRSNNFNKLNMWKVSEVREFIKNNIENQK